MSDRLHRWKVRLLTAVVFLLFLLDLGEFVVWKLERLAKLWAH